VYGSILLAQEGINGTVCSDREHLTAFIEFLRPVACAIYLKIKKAIITPFDQLKVTVKPRNRYMGRPDINPSERVGTYVRPQDWNALIQDPEVVVIDTRKPLKSLPAERLRVQLTRILIPFHEFPVMSKQSLDPTHQHPKVAMFCTGIRF
jgi:UPF0176 protein